MNTHTARTALVYRLARELGSKGDMLKTGVMVATTDNLVVLYNRGTGRVGVRDRHAGYELFAGYHDAYTVCAPTTDADSEDGEHADIDLGDIPRSWIIELQDELRAAA